jgi:hypothetical protein
MIQFSVSVKLNIPVIVPALNFVFGGRIICRALLSNWAENKGKAQHVGIVHGWYALHKVDKPTNFQSTKTNLNDVFLFFPPAHFMTIKLKIVTIFFPSTILVIFRQHFTKCCNIFRTNIF